MSYQQLEGATFILAADRERYFVIKETLKHKNRRYEAWCFYMLDIIMGDLQYVGNLSKGKFFLDDAVKHFKKHKGEPPEWKEVLG